MSLTINTNIASMVAQFNLGKNSSQLNRVSQQLATGLKLNKSSDDAAGLSISEKLKSQIKGNQQAYENSQEGINLLQVAEGSLSIISENLQRIRELTVQASNATNSSVELYAIKLEVEQRLQDISRIK